MSEELISTDDLKVKLEEAFATIAQGYATLAANGLADIGSPIAITAPQWDFPRVGLTVKVWATVAVVHKRGTTQ